MLIYLDVRGYRALPTVEVSRLAIRPRAGTSQNDEIFHSVVLSVRFLLMDVLCVHADIFVIVYDDVNI